MCDVMERFFAAFAYETGILGELRPYASWCRTGIVIVAALSCLLGFYIYRGIVAAIVFFVIALGSCKLLEGRCDWGSIVTCFSVLGTLLGCLAYRWYRLGAVVFCACIGWMLGELWQVGGIGCLLFAAVLGIAALYFPVISLCVLSSFWGTLLLLDAMNITGKTAFFTGITAIVLCSCLQTYSCKGQSIFVSPYPKKIKVWLEKRRGQNDNGISKRNKIHTSDRSVL